MPGVPTGPGAEPDRARCSSKGCGDDAVWALRWNNPRIHTPERRKLWAACEAHRGHLSTFLHERGFLKDVVPLAEAEPDPGPQVPGGPA